MSAQPESVISHRSELDASVAAARRRAAIYGGYVITNALAELRFMQEGGHHIFMALGAVGGTASAAIAVASIVESTVYARHANQTGAAVTTAENNSPAMPAQSCRPL